MIKRVLVQNLEIGMYIEELDRPWLDSPFMTQQKIEHKNFIEELKGSNVRYVYINTEKGNDSRKALDGKQVDRGLDEKLSELYRREATAAKP